jgi:hypothetical protein
LRIVNGANLLSLQFRFNQLNKLAHQGSTPLVYAPSI